MNLGSTWRGLRSLLGHGRALWLAPLVLAGIAVAAAGCGLLPGLGPVQAGIRTPTAVVATPTAVAVPQITISPADGGPGTRITVTGRGWRPGVTVFIRLEDPATGELAGFDQASAIVSDAGDFTVRFSYPTDPRWAGLPRVLITARSPAADQRATALFLLPGRVLQTATAVPTMPPTAVATAGPTATATATLPLPTATRPLPTATRVLPTATRPLPTATATPTNPPPTPTPAPVIVDWRGEYFTNMYLSGAPAVVRNDTAIDFNWGTGGPAAGLPADTFSARWTRFAEFQAATYRFYLAMDDGARLWIDGQLVIDEWRDGSVREVGVERSMTQGPHSLRVEYYERSGGALVRLRWERVDSFPEWQGEYWPNPDQAGLPVLRRNDPAIDFNWGDGAPAPGLPRDGFSVRWTRLLSLAPGVYRLFAQADGGVRVYVDGNLVIDGWEARGGTTVMLSADVRFSRAHWVEVNYVDLAGPASIKFWWQRAPAATPTRVPPPTWTPPPTPTRRVSPTPTDVGVVITPTSEPVEPIVTAVPVETATPEPPPAPTEPPVVVVTPEDGEPTAEPEPTAAPRPTATPRPPGGGQAPGGRPGRATPTPTRAPGVHINELLPVPREVDWDGDLQTTARDEWIELHNDSSRPVNLDGWALEAVGRTTTSTYRFTRRTILQPNGYLLLHRRQTGLVLDDRGGTVRLLNAQGRLVDAVRYGVLEPDASYSLDARGIWHADWPPSPGRVNRATVPPGSAGGGPPSPTPDTVQGVGP